MKWFNAAPASTPVTPEPTPGGGLPRMFIFASAEAVDADAAYLAAWHQLEERMEAEKTVTLHELNQQTAVVNRPIEIINPHTNEPEMSEYPHILITFQATVYTEWPTEAAPR